MEIENSEYTQTDHRAHAHCMRCNATGPTFCGPTESRAKDGAKKAISDYYDRRDAALWRASQGCCDA